MRKAIRTLGGAVVAAIVAVVLHQPALHALGPTVLLFYGGTLKQPVFVSGADAAVFDGLLEPTRVPASEAAGRTFINVALFWGAASNPARNGVRVITDLKPEMAWQHGRLYPATPKLPALLLATGFTKTTQPVPPPNADSLFNWGGRLGPQAIDVLQRLKIVGLKP